MGPQQFQIKYDSRVNRAPELEVQIRVLRPFKAGFPNIPKYLAEMWSRRQFVRALSKAERSEEQLDTVFGNLWGILSPLLSAGIYYLFIFVVQGGHQGTSFFLHLVAGIFIFEFISTAATRGSTSIVRAASLISNTSFPRALLPFADVLTAFKVFLPAMAVYSVIHLVLGQPVSWATLQVIPAVFLMIVLSLGLAMFTATAQVYFRDTVALAPFVLRLLMFASPVLYYPEQAKEILGGPLLAVLNPFFCLVEIFSGSLARGATFDVWTWIIASSWSFGFLIAGFIFLVTREGEFAARL